MKQFEDYSTGSQTLSPAKLPEVNPWLQRKLQLPAKTATNGGKSVDKNGTAHVIQDDTHSLPLVQEEKVQSEQKSATLPKIKPTAKDKWVHYDATIIVDTEDSSTANHSNNRKPGNRKKKQGKRKGDEEKDKHKDDHHNGHNTHKTESTNRNLEKNESNIDDVTALLEDSQLEDKENDQEFVPGVNGAYVPVEEFVPELPRMYHRSSQDLGDQRRNSNKYNYYQVPKFRRSSSNQMGVPPGQLPMYPPINPGYYYQPFYLPYYLPPPNYQINGYTRHGGRRGVSRNNSSSSSINDPLNSSSPSPSPNNSLHKLGGGDQYYPPQQFVGYYPVAPIPQHQAMYQMMSPPALSPVPQYDPYMMRGDSYSLGYSSRSNSTYTERETEIATQIDYYFSKENLSKDNYLKSIMKDDYVPLKKILEFRRLKMLTGGDSELAINSLSKCQNIEFKIVNDEYLLKPKISIPLDS